MARNSLIAVVLIVVLRLSIGWQLLYEGLWKIDTQKTDRPWTAAGYLKNSEGPLRDTFRQMAGDPDDLDWLNYDVVAARWDDWAARFKDNYQLSENQAKKLDQLLNGAAGSVDGRPVYAAELERLPPLPEGRATLKDATRVSDKYVWYDAERKRLYVDGKAHLQPGERDKLLNLVRGDDGELLTDPVSKQYAEAVNAVFERQKRGLGYKEKLAGAVRGNPDLLGTELKAYAGSQRIGQKSQYEAMLTRYEELRADAETSFQWDHLSSDWGKIQALRAEITAPVKALEKEFQDKATNLLSLNQLNMSPPSPPFSALRFADMATMWGLTILGFLLITGLFTRLSAIGAALMLFGFYMAMPPWPGVPEMPGPEHSFIVNKNLIEVIALLAIAALPTGRWFGVDAWLTASRERAAARKAAA